MVSKRSCSFCGNDIESGTGKMFVKKDGTIYFFCSKRCQKNLLVFGRVPREVRWTTAFRAARGKVTAPAMSVEAVPREEITEIPAEGVPAVLSPKGKDIPAGIIDLITRGLGRDMPREQAEMLFGEFMSNDETANAITSWMKKRKPGKIVEVPTDDVVAWLDTALAKKLLKDWVEEKSKAEERGEETLTTRTVSKRKEA